MRMASALNSDFLERVIKSYGIGHGRIILCDDRSDPVQDLISKIQTNGWILNTTINMNGHMGLVTCAYPSIPFLSHLARYLQRLELHNIQYNALIISKPTNDSRDSYQE